MGGLLGCTVGVDEVRWRAVCFRIFVYNEWVHDQFGVAVFAQPGHLSTRDPYNFIDHILPLRETKEEIVKADEHGSRKGDIINVFRQQEGCFWQQTLLVVI